MTDHVTDEAFTLTIPPRLFDEIASRKRNTIDVPNLGQKVGEDIKFRAEIGGGIAMLNGRILRLTPVPQQPQFVTALFEITR